MDRTIKLDAATIASLGRQLMTNVGNYIGVGNKKLPVNSPTAQRIITSPVVQNSLSGATTRSLGTTQAPQGKLAGSIGSAMTRPLPSYTPSIIPTATAGTFSNYPDYNQPTQEPTIQTPDTAMDFNSKIQEIVQKRAMLGNLKLQGLGEKAMASQLGLQKELGAIPEFQQLSLSQAQRFQDMREQGLEGMYGAASEALSGRRQLAKDLVTQATDLYKEAQPATVDVKPSFNEYGEYMGYFDPATREFISSGGQTPRGEYVPGANIANIFAGSKITQQYGVPVDYEANKAHNGIDFVLPGGTNADIAAPVSGTVRIIPAALDRNGKPAKVGYGNQAIITDAQGNQHMISHMSGFLVQNGMQVQAGQPIGKQGNTGYTRGATGIHVDYRIKDTNGKWMNPAQYSPISQQQGFTPMEEKQFLAYDGTDKTMPKFTSSTQKQQWIAAYDAWASSTGSKPVPTEMAKQARLTAEELLTKFKAGEGTSAVGTSRIGLIQYIPGTAPATFQNKFNTLKSQLSLDSAKLLKGQGAVSDAERAMLSEAVTELSLSQTEKDFKITLEKLIKRLGGGQPVTQPSTPQSSNNDPLGIL